VPLAQGVEAQLISDLCCIHGVGQILLVGKHQQDCVTQLVFVDHAVQLITSLTDTVAIVTVHHEDQALGVLEVMPPEGANLVLTTNIPDSKADVLVFNSLDVETCIKKARSSQCLSMKKQLPINNVS